MEGACFDVWKWEVDRLVSKLSGMSCDDLPDEDYWTNWNEGSTAHDMAAEVLHNNGWDGDLVLPS